jgi:hypothetical protein
MKRLSLTLLTALLGVLALCGTAPAQITPPAQPQRPGFEELDTDKSGTLTLDEVMVYAKKKALDLRGFAIQDVDKNHDGKLTQEELRTAGITGLEGHEVINLKDLDTNGDGYVSREELEQYIRKHYANEFRRSDADQDGVVRPREFAIFRF